MNVYKINDIISCDFLKIPKAMFANKTYRSSHTLFCMTDYHFQSLTAG